VDKKFSIIAGTYPYTFFYRSLKIAAAPKDNQPFPVDAVVFEEDTFLVLSTETTVREPRESLIRVMTKLIETCPEKPGSVVVKGRHPLRMLAVVHELDKDPTWKNEWVEIALNGIFQEAERRKLQSLALPFIGTLHGRLKNKAFIQMLRKVLRTTKCTYLKNLWLIIPPKTGRAILKSLESEGE
jgi:hypothetical protein